jgi:peptidoglycan/LPS O-acetylase OafA/YrhL
MQKAAGYQERMGQPASYRPDIDGLRAVSILLVVGYHAHPWLLPGGFVGVDVFFVISGFLITQILLTQERAGRFSIADFYTRRVRRIFPALIAVLAVTYAIGWLILLPEQFQLLGKNIAAGVLFSSNLLQLGQTGYFAPDAAENPLLHLWSLGVEEQFYIFWPLALPLLARSQHRRRWLLAIIVASFAAGLLTVINQKDWAFYSPVTRMWELLVGCLLAETKFVRSERSNLSSVVGLTAIVGSALFLDRSLSFPGAYVVLPVIGAALIIMSPNSALNCIVLSNKAMVRIGLISYPLYLWHWPLLSYLDILRNGVSNVLEIWAAVLAAVVLSVLTYLYVETPLRRRPHIAPKLAFGLACIGVIGIATVAASGFEARFPAELQQIARVRTQDSAGFHDHCFISVKKPDAGFDASCIEPGGQPLVFLWGDSTAAALYPGLKYAETTHDFRLARFSQAACAPILDSPRNERCNGLNALAFRYLQSSRPDVVLLHATWGDYRSLDGLEETISRLKALNVPRIVIVGPVPVWKRTLPHAIINTYRFRHELPKRIASGVSGPEADEAMREFSLAHGTEYISVRRSVCNPEGCLALVDGSSSEVFTTDRHHLSEAGSRFLIASIAEELFVFPPRIGLPRTEAIAVPIQR